MKKFNQRKSIIEQGGLMIEALAMLGLIAVVTPTMYKKSAERTMEVEDINTATTIRTFMNAAESYVAANYIQLLNDEDLKLPEDDPENPDPEFEATAVKEISLDDLKPYLPYKFESDNSLYNYSAPKVSVVRSGDSITAFALFPAKGGEDEGIGQERTVRIASLIGANGGYVSELEGNKKGAHGVGGVWSLDGDHFSGSNGVFKDEDPNVYSIVTSSSNIANSGAGGAEPDMTKYLQRTRENDGDSGEELWRNAMRTDLYMGKASQNKDSWNNSEELYSIQNINKLIVGTHDNRNGYSDDATAVGDDYGLYIKGSGSAGAGRGNAFINGSIEAALNNFYVDENDMKYIGPHMVFDGTKFELGKAADEMYAIKGDVSEGKKVNVFDTAVAIDAGTEGERKINILGESGDKTIQIDESKNAGTFGQTDNKKAMVAVTTADETEPDEGKLTEDNYNTAPDFGVDVDGNMVVQGILAAGQLDVNKIRAAKLSVGSEHIDDEKKWMDVDENGVHIHQPKGGSYKGTQVEVKDKLIALRTGDEIEMPGSDDEKKVSGHPAQIVMSEGGIVEKVTQKGTNAPVLALGATGPTTGIPANGEIQQVSSSTGINITPGLIDIGNVDDNIKRTDNKELPYLVNFGKGANVDIQKGNLKISDGDNPVFTVYGNKGGNLGLKDVIESQPGTGGDAVDYQIAGHGNAVFTDETDNTRYLAMGPEDKSSAVNIVSGGLEHGGKTNDSSTQLLYIDLDERNGQSYTVAPGQDTTDYTTEGTTGYKSRNMRAGSIYIRKGLIDIAPNKQHSEARTFSADNGQGVIRASRFVANNVRNDGSRVEVPNFFGSDDNDTYQKYNGTDGAERYDTYMVNPAYTSVMNDIKLVSRWGARLSDILPDFITKAIYVATNTISEYEITPKKLDRKITNSDGSETTVANFHCNSDSDIDCTIENTDGYTPLKSDGYLPASPVIGTVPAPQCPPGYSKVIQVTPSRITMAQAGQLAAANGFDETLHDYDVDGFEYLAGRDDDEDNYEKNVPLVDQPKLSRRAKIAKAIKSAEGNKEKLNGKFERNFNVIGKDYSDIELELDLLDDEDINNRYQGEMVSGINKSGTVTTYYRDKYGPHETIDTERVSDDPRSVANLRGQKLVGHSQIKDDIALATSDNTKGRYFLTSGGNSLQPLTFQKNTKMFSHSYPIMSQNDPTFGRGWLLVMGYLYPVSDYENLFSDADYKQMSDDSYFWNVFPVEIDSLEAFVTTYCYFDKSNRRGKANLDRIPKIGEAEKLFPISQEPVSEKLHGDKEFRQKLNDPSMKYNELW